MKKIALHWQILISLIFALLYGIFLPGHVKYVSWMGDIFLRGLNMIVAPLIFTSLVSGVTNVGQSKNLGRLGGKTLLYYITTSLIAIITGLILINLFQPGAGVDFSCMAEEASKLNIKEKPFSSTLIEIVPKNIFQALSQGNMLSIILFAILFGFFITRLSQEHKTQLTSLFNASFEVMMKITLFVIRFAPVGIFGIVAKVVAEQKNPVKLFNSLGLFSLLVIGGLLFHACISLPAILYLFGKVNPVKHFKALLTPLLTAFSTASSNATLPLTMEAVEDNAGVSNKISSFTLPLGATINMDGTALYELLVVGFIMQVTGNDLTIAKQIIIVLTALLSSIGTAGVPMASYVAMAIIFSAIDIPLCYMLLVMPFDRPLDMLRTSVNVWSDSCGAVIIAKSEGEKLNV